MKDDPKKFFDDPDSFTFGIITQTGYRELENRLDAQARDIRERFHRWFLISLTAFAVVGLTSSIALVGFGLLLTKQGQFTSDIQQQRRDTINGQCLDQNNRHNDTVDRLIRAEKVAEKKAATLSAKLKIRNSVEVSLGLIDSLAPLRDCNEVVREATQ